MAKDWKRAGLKQYPLRLPEDLQAKLEAIARQESRSVNAQIKVFLQEAIARYTQQAPQPAP